MPQAHEPRHLGTRSKARKRALDILFEADLRSSDPLEALADHIARAEPPVRPFTTELVQGVERNRDQIDTIIAECLTGDWTLSRMPRVDRNLARIAIFELWHGDVAGEIAVDEAVSLARELSTDESPDFLNGLLGRALTRRKAESDAVGARPAAETVEGDAGDLP